MSTEIRHKIVFPDPKGALSFNLKPLEEIMKDCIYVLDASVLLMPFTTGIKSLEALRNIYSKLVIENRLFIPSQSIREFLANRPTKLAELTDALSKKLNTSYTFFENHPLLAELPEFQNLIEKEKQLKALTKEYQQSINQVLKKVQSMSWDDPVSTLYKEILIDRILSDEGIDYKIIVSELKERNELKIPPGYRDQTKEINSAGDLIIWYEIIDLGKSLNKNLVLISGDEKNDWWHLTNKKPLYPRIELVDEYRRNSNNHAFHIISLSTFLEANQVETEIIDEVKREEENLSIAIPTMGSQRNLAQAYSFLSDFKEFVDSSISKYVKEIKPLQNLYEETKDPSVLHQLRETREWHFSISIDFYNSNYRDKILTLRNQYINYSEVARDFTLASKMNSMISNPKDITDYRIIYEELYSIINRAAGIF
jgi:septum formation inhibitor MinC